jgi:hypothetical protein
MRPQHSESDEVLYSGMNGRQKRVEYLAGCSRHYQNGKQTVLIAGFPEILG